MQNIVDRLRTQCFRDSTRLNYYRVWKNFNAFYQRLDRKPSNWEERLSLFVAFLVQTNKRSSTVKSYISAIRAILKEDSVKLNEDITLLSALTRACKIRNDVIINKLLIRRPLLNMLLPSIKHYFADNPQPYLVKLYRAILSTTYFGLFRIGEMCKSPHALLTKDVHIGRNKNKMMFLLHSSKTHTKGDKPQVIKISEFRRSNTNVRG